MLKGSNFSNPLLNDHMYFNLEMRLNCISLEDLPSNLLEINVLIKLKVWVIIFRVKGIYFLDSVLENQSFKKTKKKG